MPEIRVITPPVASAEPVSLALLAAHVRADIDANLLAAYQANPSDTPPANTDAALWAEASLLALYLSAAREKVEAYTGRYFAAQQLSFTYTLEEPYGLPGGATATAVSGFFTDLADLDTLPTWLEEYRKGISVNRELPWGAALLQTYTVVATVTGDTSYGHLAKRAILELAAEWYKNRETTADARGLSELPVSWKVTLAQAVVNPLGFS